jgi:YggT family protein
MLMVLNFYLAGLFIFCNHFYVFMMDVVFSSSTICDPYLNIFRGIIPPLGGTLDFSPILAFLVLNAFTSTASALPAELPATGTPEEGCASLAKFTNSTTSQEKWMRRLHGNKSKSSSGVN